MFRRKWVGTALAACVLAAVAIAATGAVAGSDSAKSTKKVAGINHLVVIYEENHSFDNLYGGWEGVNGLSNATQVKSLQVDQNGLTYGCLLQLDVNLTSPPVDPVCKGTNAAGSTFSSAFSNDPFSIDNSISPSDTTCPAPGAFSTNGFLKGTALPGGCTRDIVHRFYQEQYQLDGGKQDRYATGSDAAGLVMGNYNTKALPIYQYLHSPGAPSYAIMDDFFQGAFGGSFLNHQILVAATAPVDSNPADAGLHSILDSAGFPNSGYPLYKPIAGATYKDAQLTQACGLPTTVAGLACGDYGVNTMQPSYQPKGSGAVLPPQTGKNIGDEMSAAGVDWAWYAGGWSNAAGNVGQPGWTNGNGPTCSDPNATANPSYPYCPDKVFQYHHQPFNYFAAFDPSTQAGQANRAAHLKDEAEFLSTAQGSGSSCGLKAVSFVKPIGEDNEHPGYASESAGSSHLVKLIKAIEGGACAKDTLVLVTYDEFGGQWDHVAPPSVSNPSGPYDQWGPGTRIPALVFAPGLHSGETVDSTEHDTTSFLSTIEHQFGLAPLTSRDAQVNDLFTVYGSNLVPNGDVEADPSSTYSTNGSGTFTWATDQSHSSSHSLKLVTTQGSSALARWMTNTNGLPVTANSAYDFAGWVKTSGVGVNAVTLTITFWDGSGNYIGGSATDSSPLGGTTDWTSLSVHTIAPGGAAYARIEFRLTGPGTIWVDDVAAHASA